jgi:hypothetical protein
MCGIAAPAVVGLSRPVWERTRCFRSLSKPDRGVRLVGRTGRSAALPLRTIIDGASRKLFASEHNEEPNVEP